MAVALAPVRAVPVEDRLVDAALRCIARWGVAKTTLDDVAREAGCSRATAYRAFAGGKDGLLDAVAAREVARFCAGVGERVAGAESVEELLTGGIHEAAVRFRDHAALQFLVTHEPGSILPQVAFGHFDEVLSCAAAFAAPHLSRFLPQEQAARVAEWATRLVLSFCVNPADGFDLGDEASVRRLVRTFVLPGLDPLLQPRHSTT